MNLAPGLVRVVNHSDGSVWWVTPSSVELYRNLPPVPDSGFDVMANLATALQRRG
jgi:hypothetical protein